MSKPLSAHKILSRKWECILVNKKQVKKSRLVLFNSKDFESMHMMLTF